jgi:hypothetical protein
MGSWCATACSARCWPVGAGAAGAGFGVLRGCAGWMGGATVDAPSGGCWAGARAGGFGSDSRVEPA